MLIAQKPISILKVKNDNKDPDRRPTVAETNQMHANFRALCWALVVIAGLIILRGVPYMVDHSYIVPSEDNTRQLYVHQRHFFAGETVVIVEVRRSDHGTTEWMAKAPDGSWNPYFHWDDE